MIGNDNQTRVLIEFFKHEPLSGKGLQLREIGRKINLAPTSVKKYPKELESKGIVIKKLQSENNYPIYFPNLGNKEFRYLKNLHVLHALRELGLIEHVEKECRPDVMVVSGLGFYGSAGDVREIKLFLGCEKKELNLENYERELGLKIIPVFSKGFSDLTSELEEEVINGIVLKGVLRFVEAQNVRKAEEGEEEARERAKETKRAEKEAEEEGFYTRIMDV